METEEALKDPSPDITSKNWRARVLGYQKVADEFRNGDVDANIDFLPFVSDLVPAAQEAGLMAMMAYSERSAMPNGSEIAANIVSKALGSVRTINRDLGLRLLLQMVEMDQLEIVLEALLGGLKQKNIKVVIEVLGCLESILEKRNEFDRSKELLIQLPALFERKRKLMLNHDQNHIEW